MDEAKLCLGRHGRDGEHAGGAVRTSTCEQRVKSRSRRAAGAPLPRKWKTKDDFPTAALVGMPAT